MQQKMPLIVKEKSAIKDSHGGSAERGGHEDPGRSEFEGFRREFMRRETHH